MRVSAIAKECGYRDPDALSHLFRKRFGMSMRDWRRANQHGGSAKQPWLSL